MKLPSEPVADSGFQSGGLPLVGLHRRNGVFYHESSYSHLCFVASMVALAVASHFLLANWHKTTSFGLEMRHLVALGLLWGGICSLAGCFVRNACGLVITFY